MVRCDSLPMLVLALLVGLSAAQNIHTLCPPGLGACKCYPTINPHTSPVLDCSEVTDGNDFLEIPAFISGPPARFSKFIIRRSQIMDLPPDALGSIQAEEIEIENNPLLESLQPGSLGNPDPKRVHIRNNPLLEEVPFEDFKRFRNVQIIYLNDNRILEIPEYAFQGISPFLREIYLQRNIVLDVGRFAFRNLPQLKRVDLSQNQLAELGPASLFFTIAPDNINLKGNKIVTLDPDTFSDPASPNSGAFAKQIDLSNNALEVLTFNEIEPIFRRLDTLKAAVDPPTTTTPVPPRPQNPFAGFPGFPNLGLQNQQQAGQFGAAGLQGQGAGGVQTGVQGLPNIPGIGGQQQTQGAGINPRLGNQGAQGVQGVQTAAPAANPLANNPFAALFPNLFPTTTTAAPTTTTTAAPVAAGIPDAAAIAAAVGAAGAGAGGQGTETLLLSILQRLTKLTEPATPAPKATPAATTASPVTTTSEATPEPAAAEPAANDPSADAIFKLRQELLSAIQTNPAAAAAAGNAVLAAAKAAQSKRKNTPNKRGRNNKQGGRSGNKKPDPGAEPTTEPTNAVRRKRQAPGNIPPNLLSFFNSPQGLAAFQNFQQLQNQQQQGPPATPGAVSPRPVLSSPQAANQQQQQGRALNLNAPPASANTITASRASLPGRTPFNPFAGQPNNPFAQTNNPFANPNTRTPSPTPAANPFAQQAQQNQQQQQPQQQQQQANNPFTSPPSPTPAANPFAAQIAAQQAANQLAQGGARPNQFGQQQAAQFGQQQAAQFGQQAQPSAAQFGQQAQPSAAQFGQQAAAQFGQQAAAQFGQQPTPQQQANNNRLRQQQANNPFAQAGNVFGQPAGAQPNPSFIQQQQQQQQAQQLQQRFNPFAPPTTTPPTLGATGTGTPSFVINFSGNPINCECETKWIYDFRLKYADQIFGLQCLSNGLNIFTLPEQHFAAC